MESVDYEQSSVCSEVGDEEDEKEKAEDITRELARTLEREVHTEDLICQIEQRPLLWDHRLEDYSDKAKKRKTWKEVINTLLPHFQQLTASDKNSMVTMVQKKWRNLRTCYARELLKRRTGRWRRGRRQYVYFELLGFLESVTKNNVNQGSLVGEASAESRKVDTPKMPIRSQSRTKNNIPNLRARTDIKHCRAVNDNMNLIKIVTEPRKAFEEDDEDKMFLLSLLSEVKKVPPANKLKLKSDIIFAISVAQRVRGVTVLQQQPFEEVFPCAATVSKPPGQAGHDHDHDHDRDHDQDHAAFTGNN